MLATVEPPWSPTANKWSKSPLGPGAFENGNIGALTRRVPVDRLVSACPPSQGNPKPPRESKTPRVADLLRKAIEWQQAFLELGEIASQAEIARREGITRARETQVMGMLRLHSEIQEQILAIPDTVCRAPLTERMLRALLLFSQSNANEQDL